MRFTRLDPTDHEEMRELTELFRVGSTIDDPPAMLGHFARWFGRQRRADFFVSVSRRGMADGSYKITRRIRGGPDPAAKPPDPWRDWNDIAAHRGGVIGEILTQETPQVLVDLDARDDPVLGDELRDMRAAFAIPNYDRGEALNWAISFFREGPPDRATIRSAMLDINMLGMATRNLVSRREAERLNNELTSQFERIAGIQRALLPQRLPTIPGLELATSYLTSNEAGGDYYDFFPTPDGRWGILIADVAGHGAAAATVMAMLRGILHCYEKDDFAPASVMEYANTKLLATNLPGTFITAFFAVYDPALGVLEFARCGHNQPRVRRADGRVIELDGDGGLPLGIAAPMGVHTAAARLDPGDTLVLYTDGITEAFGPDREMFGVYRLDEALRGCTGAPECVVDSVHRALYRHTGVMDRDDDQTLVVLRRRAGDAS